MNANAIGLFIGLNIVILILFGVQIRENKFWIRYTIGKLEMYNRHSEERHMTSIRRNGAVPKPPEEPPP